MDSGRRSGDEGENEWEEREEMHLVGEQVRKSGIDVGERYLYILSYHSFMG